MVLFSYCLHDVYAACSLFVGVQAYHQLSYAYICPDEVCLLCIPIMILGRSSKECHGLGKLNLAASAISTCVLHLHDMRAAALAVAISYSSMTN